jgi:hypothetical protein
MPEGIPIKTKRVQKSSIRIKDYRFNVILSGRTHQVLKELKTNNEYVFYGAVQALKLRGSLKDTR